MSLKAATLLALNLTLTGKADSAGRIVKAWG